jgi:hypothetical protein
MIKLHVDYDDLGPLIVVDNETFGIRYPEDVWKKFPFKLEFASELMFLRTCGLALLAADRQLCYSGHAPRFLDEYRSRFELEIPRWTERYWLDSAWLRRRQFRSKQVLFSKPPLEAMRFENSSSKAAILGLSCGKDSLASLVLAKEMDLDVHAVYISNSLHSGQTEYCRPHLHELSGQTGVEIAIIENDVSFLMNPKNWSFSQSRTAAGLSMETFILSLVPFANYYGAKNLLLGIEYESNLPALRRWGGVWPHSVNRSFKGLAALNSWVGSLTNGTISFASLIPSLYSGAILRIIHGLYPEIGFHQISCTYAGLTPNGRWCHDCGECAEAYLHILAYGGDPAEYGFFGTTMFDKDKNEHFDEDDPSNPLSYAFFWQGMLANLYAHRRGATGWRMEQFEKKYLAKTEKREHELVKWFLSVQDIPQELCLSRMASDTIRKVLCGQLSR